MAKANSSENSSNPIQPRRMPQQARSRERVDRILDAAASLLREEGYNSVKTNHIAKRANISIGSVYQFFPNKFAIFHALAERYRERIGEGLIDLFGPESFDIPWEESVDRCIDALAQLWRDEWSTFSVITAIQNTAELREPDMEYKNRLIDGVLIHFYRRILPNTPDERLHTIASVAFDTHSLLLENSMLNGDEQDQALVDELRFLVKSYVSSHIERDAAEAETPNPPTETALS